MSTRKVVLERLADVIAAARGPNGVRVAIDGADAAGKTTLAGELAPLVESRGRSVTRVSIDDFLRPAAERHRRGRDSPEGYYLDSFDHGALRTHVLGVQTDVVLVDGVFMLRPELDDLWCVRVFVEVDFDELLRRGVARDGEEMRRLYMTRYLPAQRRYVDEVAPHRRADAVLENTEPEEPTLRY